MTRKAKVLAAPLAAAVAILVGAVHGASGPAVTIASPAAGQHISLRATPYVAVAGSAAFAAPAATMTRFYLRRDGCGTSDDNPHLSVTSGTDAGDGCGLTLTSATGLGGTVDQGASTDYPSADGMPLAFDGSREVTGTIDVQSVALVSPAAAGAGVMTVTVDLEALVDGAGVDVGSDSENVVVSPTQADYPVAFTIHPSSTVDGADVSGLDLRVHLSGPYVASGFIGNSGKSYVDVPGFSASTHRSVEVSIDDPTFANAVPARLSGNDWSVALPTPAAGKHMVYVQATQGFDTGDAASRSFSVSR